MLGSNFIKRSWLPRSTISKLVVGTAAASFVAFSKSKCDNDTASQPLSAPTAEELIPSLEEYEHIHEGMYNGNLESLHAHHILYSCLSGPGRVQRYEVYRHKSKEEILAIVEFGDAVTGWPKIVHGGLSSLLLDNTFGWLLHAYSKPTAVTAYLNINFRSPIFSRSTSLLTVRIDRQEGKKLFMSGDLRDARTGRVQVEADSLFVEMNVKRKAPAAHTDTYS